MVEKYITSRAELFDLINRGDIIVKLSLATIALALGGVFTDAYDFGSIGIGVLQLEQQLHLTAVATGTLTAAMAFGALIGALLSGPLIDRTGRFYMFITDLILFVIGAIGAALSINYYMLVAFRFLLGIGVGIDFPVALTLVSEYSALKNRGRNVGLWQSMWYIATVAIYAVALLMYLNYSLFGENLWRWIIGFGAIPATMIIILRYKYLGESPLWLFAKGKPKEIEKYLYENGYTNVRISPNLEDIFSFGNLRHIFSKEYRNRTAISSIVSTVESFEYFAVGFYLPVILTALFHGVTILAISATALVNIAGIIGGTSQAYVVGRLGLRKVTLIGLLGVITLLLGLSLIGKLLPAIVSSMILALFILFHSFGPGSQGMTYGTLSYPPNLRGTGAGFSQASVRVGSILGFYTLPLLSAAIGLYNTLLVITFGPLLALITVLIIKWDPIFKQDIDYEALKR